MVRVVTRQFEKAKVDGADLEYEVRGDGEPVLFIHGSIIGDAFAPLLSQSALQPYMRVSYHRRGFAGSTHPDAPLSIARQAADARALLDLLGVSRAHVVGHSYGGVIALQLALDAPDRVHSLALLEPGTLWSAQPTESMAMIEPIVQMYESGDRAGAIDAFCQAVAGPSYQEAIESALGRDWVQHVFEQAIADAGTLFEVELPALLEWQFTRDQAARITQPVLSVLGAESAAIDPAAAEEHEMLQSWMPQTEAFVLPAATHALQMMNPSGMAAGLAEFLQRHPISEGA